MERTKARWKELAPIQLSLKAPQLELIFAPINRKDKPIFLEMPGSEECSPIYQSQRSYWHPCRITALCCAWLPDRAISPSVSSLIYHLENTPSAISSSNVSL